MHTSVAKWEGSWTGSRAGEPGAARESEVAFKLSTWRCALHLRGWREQSLTKQLDAPREAVDIHQGPERVGRADPVEEEHGSRVIDAVEHAALLVHPEGDDVALVCKLFG